MLEIIQIVIEAVGLVGESANVVSVFRRSSWTARFWGCVAGLLGLVAVGGVLGVFILESRPARIGAGVATGVSLIVLCVIVKAFEPRR